jgi:hypothetical protein
LITDGHFPLFLRPYDLNPAAVVWEAFLPDSPYPMLVDAANNKDFQLELARFIRQRFNHYLCRNHSEARSGEFLI